MELWKYADLYFKQTSCLMGIALEKNGVFIKTYWCFNNRDENDIGCDIGNTNAQNNEWQNL